MHKTYTATMAEELPEELKKSGPPYIVSSTEPCEIGSVTISVNKKQSYFTLREVSKAVFIRYRGEEKLDQECKYFYEVSLD